jgi:hypothetical protein
MLFLAACDSDVLGVFIQNNIRLFLIDQAL